MIYCKLVATGREKVLLKEEFTTHIDMRNWLHIYYNYNYIMSNKFTTSQ